MKPLTQGMRAALVIMAAREKDTGRKWGPIEDVDKRSLYGLEGRGLAVRNGYQGVAKLTDEGFDLATKTDDGAATPPADLTATPAATGGGETGVGAPKADERATGVGSTGAVPSSPRWYCKGCTRKQRQGSWPCSLCCGFTGKRFKVATGVTTAVGRPSKRVPS